MTTQPGHHRAASVACFFSCHARRNRNGRNRSGALSMPRYCLRKSCFAKVHTLLVLCLGCTPQYNPLRDPCYASPGKAYTYYFILRYGYKHEPLGPLMHAQRSIHTGGKPEPMAASRNAAVSTHPRVYHRWLLGTLFAGSSSNATI